MTQSPEIKADQVDDILKGITIPSPPQVMADLQMELVMPEPDLAAMAGMISRDVGLAGSVLKTVNSPFFGMTREITSIGHAVNLLGINSIVNIVNAYFLRNEMINRDLSDETVAAMTRFWDSAMDVANAATLVAKQLHHPNPDQAYLLGLFHNAGIPLLMQKFGNYPEIQKAAYADTEGRLTLIENQHLESSHQVMSYYVARAWKLPKDICTIIRSHHNLERLSEESEGLIHLAGMLKLAEHLAGLHRILGDQETDHEWQRIGGAILQDLELSEDDYDDIRSLANDMGIGQQSYYM